MQLHTDKTYVAEQAGYEAVKTPLAQQFLFNIYIMEEKTNYIVHILKNLSNSSESS